MKNKPLLFLTVSLLFLGIIGWFYGSNKGFLLSSFGKSGENPVHSAAISSGAPLSNSFDSKSKNDVSEGSRSTSSASVASNLATTGSPFTSELGGTPAKAQVQVGKKSFQLEPDIMGGFPRVNVPANGTIQIRVEYPEGFPNDPLVIQAEDGGKVDQSSVVKQGQLDDQRGVSFEFKTAQEAGIYRVTLRKGTDEKRFDFWVGEEPRLQKGS